MAALVLLGLPKDVEELAGRGKWLREKAVIAAVIRKRTGVGNRWIARRFAMGQESSVVRAVGRAKEDAVERQRMQDLEKRLAADYQDRPQCGPTPMPRIATSLVDAPG
jgi:hypothetical protein